MLVFLSHRHLRPGSWDQYREAWQPERQPEGVLRRIYHARSLTDPDDIVSFGIADVGADELPALRERFGGSEAEARRQERMAPFVEGTGVDAVFEVVEELVLE